MQDVIKYPLATEKAIRMIEAENTLTFIVDRKADKKEVRKEIEGLYKVKVEKVNTAITPKGLKKAYVKLTKEVPAIDIATQLGLI